MPGYEVITKAVRDEAPKWDGFAEKAEEIRRAVEDATLGPFAFFVGDPVALVTGLSIAGTFNTALHQRMYETYRSHVHDLLAGAKTEFEQIADAVGRIAATYEEQEEIGELNFREIYGEMPK
jgi:hypothetical protein